MQFNVHEEFWDRPCMGNDQTNHVPRFLILIISNILKAIFKVFFRMRIENQEVMDGFKGKTNGAILVAPHYSYLDVIVMWLSVRPRGWVRLIARESLFYAGKGFLGEIISRAGAFPIKRNTADRTALKRAARMLKNGEWVGMFPEGTRRGGKGNLKPELHAGAALIARMGKAPIIPLGLENLSKIKRKGERVRFPKVTIRFGEPVSLDSFNFLPKEDRMDACAWYTMREAYALSENIAPTEVDMVDLFPDAKDYSKVFYDHPIELFDPSTLPDYDPQAKAAKAEKKQDGE